jgi:hypothetical protein
VGQDCQFRRTFGIQALVRAGGDNLSKGLQSLKANGLELFDTHKGFANAN